jgi:anti-sigma regulatory factor (Ser/Thr protein kinase)
MSQRRTFDHANESVGLARRFVSQAIHGASPEIIQTVALMVSELASNCIRHTDSRFELAVTSKEGEIRVEATDRGRGEPVVRNPGPTDPSGRGLQIVDMLAADWGVEVLPEKGKTVWFTVLVPAHQRVAARCAT